MFKVPEKNRIPGLSNSEYGNNGAFAFKVMSPNGRSLHIQVQASDGEGWEHVSVTFINRKRDTPSWDVMCFIKDKFWDESDVVVQIHPKKTEYVNIHKHCLHLWRESGRNFDTPATILL
jgi:hypothetical protein